MYECIIETDQCIIIIPGRFWKKMLSFPFGTCFLSDKMSEKDWQMHMKRWWVRRRYDTGWRWCRDDTNIMKEWIEERDFVIWFDCHLNWFVHRKIHSYQWFWRENPYKMMINLERLTLCYLLFVTDEKKSRFILRRRGAWGEQFWGLHWTRPLWSHLHSRQGPLAGLIFSPIW